MPSVPDLRADVLLRGEETSGHVSVTEIVVPPHTAGPPLHVHNFDEAFYLLEGELIIQVEDALEAKVAGDIAFAPRNIAAEAAGIAPPQWTLQPIPEVTVVGPQIAAPTRGPDQW